MKFRSSKRSYSVLCNNSGSILSRIIIALVTLIVIGGALYFLLKKKEEINKDDHRKAEVISDYGLQLVMTRINESLNGDPAKIGNVEKTEYEQGFYEVLVKTGLKDSILTISVEAKGYCGDQIFSRKEDVVLCRTLMDSQTVWVPKIDR